MPAFVDQVVRMRIGQVPLIADRPAVARLFTRMNDAERTVVERASMSSRRQS